MQSAIPTNVSHTPSGSNNRAPFRIEPAYNTRPWGSTDLTPWYDGAPSGERIGEVWLTGYECRVASGPQAGRPLGEVLTESNKRLLGNSAELLLIKVIFAQEKLSVQVHPDDAMAREQGAPRGKTECWYVLDAQPGAQVALGLKPGLTLAHLREGIAANTLESSLQTVTVKRGESLLVESGTVHAIWPGSVLLEVQQYSDLTYRLYDYGRPRELHIEKALEAIKLDAPAVKVAPQALAGRTLLVESPYFRLERVVVNGSLSSHELSARDEGKLQYLFVSSGSARLSGPGFESFELPRAAVAVIPAAASAFTIEDGGGLELIRIV